MLFSITLNLKRSEAEKKNAISKAPADVIRTLTDLGCSNIILFWDRFSIYPLNIIYRLWQCIKVYNAIGTNDTLIIQGVTPLILKLIDFCRKKGVRVIYIVHDLNYIRYKRPSIELEACKHMDEIIVHTEGMRDKLISDGIKTPMKVLYLFDYYSDNPMPEAADILKNKHRIAFAGNIEKSVFLHENMDIPAFANRYKLYLYGNSDNTIADNLNHCIEYKGSFLPDKTGHLAAGWGLVWDGYSMDSCKGNLGEYLKINSSHKISLYLACGIPLIVWSESSIGQWLVKQEVAVAIDRISDIPNIIDNISEQQYLLYIQKAQLFGKKLRQGTMLSSVVSSVYKDKHSL